MKLNNLTVIASFAMLLLLASACGNNSNNSRSGMHSHNESNKGGDEMGMGGHSHDMGDHMGHMNDVRKWLKGELGEMYNSKVPAPTSDEIKAGKAVYVKVCSSCHGTSGKGDGPAAAALNPKPANFTDTEHSMFYSDRGRLYIIKKGIKGTAMVGWENTLSDTEINNVYAYVRSLRGSGSEQEEHDHEHEHEHEHSH